MSEPTISPPTEMDASLPLEMLAVQMYHTPNQYSELEYRLLRRCHAAESERDRLAARLNRAEELLLRLAKPCRCGKPGCGYHDAAAFLAESNPTEKQA